ncbi:MAG: hypothetical protein WCA21_14765 [Terracidiphilus sp.]
MKRRLWISIAILIAGYGVVIAVGALEQAMKPKPDLPSFLPSGALLTIEARDFSSLIRDWNSSPQKRAWLVSDNHSVFSTSRLYTRLSQAQDEFSAAAGLPTDGSLLEKVAGKESCLGLYDIGNLEFVYITRLDKQEIEDSPLWQKRSSFAQRNEAGSVFYVHKDEASSRVAAFASKDGWLIIGTREDLVAGVLDRVAGVASQSLSDEEWFAEAIKQAPSSRGDLRMVLNLEKIVISPYFRSYWIQQNITEMKQYASVVSDLYRSNGNDREERVLLRRTALTAPAQGDVQSIVAMAPEDAAFYAAEASPNPEKLLTTLRDDLLETKPEQAAERHATAPSAAGAEDAGSADQLDTSIDKAPVAVLQADPFQPLRAMLIAGQVDASLEVFSTRAPRDGVFVSLQTAMAVSSAHGWDEEVVSQALSDALLPGLTAGKLGVHWEKRSSASGEYLALDGSVPLYFSINGKQLLLANDSTLLEQLLARRQRAISPAGSEGVTYTAFFRHAHEQGNYRRLVTQLDLAGHRDTADQSGSAGGEAPAFFSGNAASLSNVLSTMESERIEERDRGVTVTQTVIYQWAL